ncbi:MAG: class I SAM-dependent methyltransferase [Polyangiaceae bacterium]|nr:class I SAM-dependent methyltransferase [Polyangiaceae bacterium]
MTGAQFKPEGSMDVLTALNPGAEYSTKQLQFILGAWIVGSAFERKDKISLQNGDVSEDDYTKQSIYALLYSLYSSMGETRSETGATYQLTFNTWGYTWPESWGPCPNSPSDPQRFGKNAYTGLYQFDAVKEYVKARDGRVSVVELGCGTGAGAHHVCSHVLPKCTYEAVDMQQAAIATCRRKFVPELGGRLVATRADATRVAIPDATADFLAVCETHVTEMAGRTTPEDRRFFENARRILKPGGYLVWGNAIPDSTWQPCFDLLKDIGMKQIEVRDVTAEAVKARDEDAGRVDAYVEQCLDRFYGFRIPVLGEKRRAEARLALYNFYRNPGTNLYENMRNGTDSYKVVLFQKPA